MVLQLCSTAWFWIALITVLALSTGIRYAERSVKLLLRPDATMVRASLPLRIHVTVCAQLRCYAHGSCITEQVWHQFCDTDQALLPVFDVT